MSKLAWQVSYKNLFGFSCCNFKNMYEVTLWKLIYQYPRLANFQVFGALIIEKLLSVPTMPMYRCKLLFSIYSNFVRITWNFCLSQSHYLLKFCSYSTNTIFYFQSIEHLSQSLWGLITNFYMFSFDYIDVDSHLFIILSSSQAFKLIVGGKDG